MKTRDKILEKSRILFNARGVDQVPTREIATEIGISIGNLCYHFPKKEDILEALALQLHNDNNFYFNPIESQNFSLLTLRDHLRKVFKNQLKHKWLFNNFAGMILSVDRLSNLYRETNQARNDRMQTVLIQLADNGYLDQTMVRRDLETLNVQLNIIGRNWSSEAEINFSSLSTSTKVDYYANLIIKVLRPYYTEKGEKNAQSILLSNNTDTLLSF